MWGCSVAHRQTGLAETCLKPRGLTLSAVHTHALIYEMEMRRVCHTHKGSLVCLWLWLCTNCTASSLMPTIKCVRAVSSSCDPESGLRAWLWSCRSVTQKLWLVSLFLRRIGSISTHGLGFESNWLNRMLNSKDGKINSKFTELEFCILNKHWCLLMFQM